MYPAQKLCLSVATLSVAIIVAPMSATAEPVATIKKLSGEVSILRGTETLPASLGARVHRDDRIATGSQGRIGLLFDDDSRLAAGPGSTLSLADYSYDPRTHAGGIDVRVDAGTVSLIAGKLAEHNPDALKVSSPATDITVSGNAFSVKVDNSTTGGNDQ